MAHQPQNEGLMGIPTVCSNLNRIHDSVGKTLRTAKQGRVIANSPGCTRLIQALASIIINTGRD